MASTVSELAGMRAVTLWAVLASITALAACSGARDDEGPQQPSDEAGAGAAGRAGGDARSGRGGSAATEAGTGASTGDAGSSGDAGDDVDAGADAGRAGSDAGGSGGEGGSGEPAGDGICTRDGACEEAVELAPGSHVQGDIDYGELPPAGGPHNPCWDDYGVHDELLPPENWVHNLEHGAVVFLYDCPGGCDAEVAMLEAFVGERPWGILTPYDGLTTRFAVVAWGYRLMTEELDLDAFAAFYDAHADRAPESVSSGKPAGCP